MNLPKLLLCILTFTVMIMVSCQKEQLDRKDQLENQTNAIERQQSHNAIDAITGPVTVYFRCSMKSSIPIDFNWFINFL